MSYNSGSNNLLNFTLRLGQSIFLGIAGWYVSLYLNFAYYFLLG